MQCMPAKGAAVLQGGTAGQQGAGMERHQNARIALLRASDMVATGTEMLVGSMLRLSIAGNS